eukprot:TRINITY_DN11233_c0_g1_i1.p1 TRINITY_DN11233_c0_g1~~TRINITY_DN11233_c0_g1_i1.p1  ORF type:complete len:219 (+),score=34.24 TRINITY_DN11233_c0_g1_i1:86-742(+)
MPDFSEDIPEVDDSTYKKYKQQANEGDPQAQYLIAQCYREGKGMASANLQKAYEWHQKAADKGYVMSIRKLAYFNLKGWGTGVNLTKAIELWTEAAAQGETSSAFNIAVTYERGGADIPVSTEKALYWYQWAAARGHMAAMNNLGLLLSKLHISGSREYYVEAASRGLHVAQYNLYRATDSKNRSRLKWLKNAADNGNRVALSDLQRMRLSEKNAAAG